MKPHRAFGQNLRAMRRRRGLSLRALAGAMQDRNGGDALGLQAPELSLLERGRRGVTIEQWLLLAAALDCPPVLLLTPLGTADTLEVTRQSHIHPHLALQWIVGDVPLTTTERRVTGHTEWLRMRQPLQLYQRLADAQEAVRTDHPGRPLPPADVRAVYEPLAAVLTDMAVAAVQPPDLGAWTVGRLAQLGYPPDRLGVGIFTPDDWYRDHGPPTALRHPALPEPVDIPADLVDDYLKVGWDHA